MPRGKMEVVRLGDQGTGPVDLSDIPREITEFDQRLYESVTSVDLTQEQKQRVLEPSMVRRRQSQVLAVHWHPEFVPMDIIMTRVRSMFPNVSQELIIPTQHNELLTLNGYAGVEVDCYASGFNRKVQLLLHFKEENVAEAHTLRAMLRHTFQYRASQLFEFLDSLVKDEFEDRRQKAASVTGATEEQVEFCAIYADKLHKLIDRNWAATPGSMIKNKLLRNFMDGLRSRYGEKYISRVQVYLKAVKKLVKEQFSLKFFYRASEIIEEARSLGAGVVIPHPEQFWPVLLADYDVDGYEVWNPQSQEYTEFLINVVNRQNESRCRTSEPLLIFMGDDCHMGEKVKDSGQRDEAKAAREIGHQPAWEDMGIRKSLIVAGMDRARVIEEYKQRLA